MRFLGFASLVALVMCGCGSEGNSMFGTASNDPRVGSGTTGTGSIGGGSTVGAGTTTGGTGVPGSGAGARPGGGGVIVPPRDAGTGTDAGNDVEEPDADRCAALDSTKSVVLYQSADDSNSMASPAIARRLILTGRRVPAGILRTYEFMNYYRFGYEPAEAGRVRVVPEMRPGKTEGEYSFQVGIQSEKPPARRAMNITFVLDTSGSMNGTPMSIEIASVMAMAAVMQQGDRVSMVTWNTENRVPLDGHVVNGPNDPALVAAASGLSASGGTDLSGGLSLGYDIARRNYDKLRLNRVVLISDGMANVGVTDENVIGMASHSEDEEGIYLVGVSVGDGINDTLMDVVTDKGRGAYVYLDSAEEASRMLTNRFDETMEVAARGVRLELTLPWYLSMKTFSGEQSSTNPDLVDPQHLSPDDAMVFNETFVSCAPSSVNPADTIGVKATYQTPIAHEAREDGATVSIADLLAGRDTELRKGSAIVAYAEALRDADKDPGTATAKLDAALAKVREANSAGSDADLIEITDLLTRYRQQFP
jgi:Ca-activated chloride channel family protein